MTIRARAKYFDPEADVVPFEFICPPPRHSDCYFDSGLTLMLFHRWAEVVGIDVFTASEVAFKSAEQIPEMMEISRSVDEKERHTWHLQFCEAPTARDERTLSEDGYWEVTAHWGGDDRLQAVAITRLKPIHYRFWDWEGPVDTVPPTTVEITSHRESFSSEKDHS